MKFRVNLKDPDTLDDAISDAVTNRVLTLDALESAQEREAVAEIRKQRVRDACNKWFTYGECITLEIDTEAMTCIVLPAGSLA